ncbi:MAG: DNA mismatch repair protein MutS [Pseudolabrys sp.]|nr:DNA mismatch repair protein MutS [Pseudolabrys sp.]
MSCDGKRRRGLSYEERVLWTTVTKAIKPLCGSSPLPLGEVDARSASGEGLKPNESPKPSHPGPLPKGERGRTEVAAKASKSAPQPTALGRRMKQRVARGKEKIDARLDLHGFTQSEAHGALLRFLRSANARDARLVLVITGKGRGGEIGVLRRQVPQWLGLPEFRDLVIGFEDAHAAHGGEGALYVRVRRAKSR